MSGLGTSPTRIDYRLDRFARFISRYIPDSPLLHSSPAGPGRPPLPVGRQAYRPGVDQSDPGGQTPNPSGSARPLSGEPEERPAPAELPIGRIGSLVYRILGGDPDAKKEKYRLAIEEHIAATGEWPRLKYIGDSLILPDEGD